MTDVNRKVPLAVLAAIFALAVVAVGRMRGLMALVALAVSFLVLMFFILPAILQGSNPLVVAVVGSSAIMLIALYMCHGLSARTSVAVLGTLISLLLIGLLGSLFIGWASLSGNTDDNTGLIKGLYPDIDMSGLLLASVIIGSLGVLDDVTVTQTSAVWELHQADPGMGPRGLYRAGIRIGRDHIASVVNTLVLAYAGAALPLLLLFSIAQSSMGTVANSELVAEEIVRTLVGSIGLVASVPVTTALAALVVSADRAEGPAARGPAAGSPRRRGRTPPPRQVTETRGVVRPVRRRAGSGGRLRRRAGKPPAGPGSERLGDGASVSGRAGALLGQDPAERRLQVVLEVAECPFLTERNQLVRTVEEGDERWRAGPEQGAVAADLEPDGDVREPFGLGRGDVDIAVSAGPVDPVEQQLTAEGPGHGCVPGEVERHPHRVGIPGLIPQFDRDLEGELLGDEEAHQDLGLNRLSHHVPRSR